MLKIARILIVALCCILICVLGTIYSFIRFKNPSNVGVMARWFGRLYPLFGLNVEHRFPKNKENMPRCIYIGNHQNNFDMVTISYMVLPRTVSVGKKSLIWIPFFGILYWVTGNIFLDRENRSKAHSTMTELARRINKDNLSIWMFLKVHVAVVAVYCHSKQVHSMQRLQLAYQSCLWCARRHITKLI